MKKYLKIIFKKAAIFLLLFSLIFPFNVFSSLETSSLENHDYVPGEIIVKYKNKDASLSSIENNKVGLKKKERVFKEISNKNKEISLQESFEDAFLVYKLEFDKGADLEKIIREYRKNPNIEYAHLNYRAVLNALPNDTSFNLQWGLQNTGQLIEGVSGTVGADISAVQGWDVSRGSEEIIIAVLDTGIDYNHEDLAGNMWTDGSVYGHDFADGDTNPIDVHGHGTHVAGIIAAVTDNGKGVAGVSWNSKLMAIKIFKNENDGDGYPIGGTTDQIANAIIYAVDNGAHIISNSWGFGVMDEPPSLIKNAIDYANSSGSLVVFAAGNSNSEGSYQPAAYSGTLAVAATDQNDERAIYPPTQGSNYGEWVDVSAPGKYIYSTLPGNSYGFRSGTSMAAPFVSGLAAIIWSYNPLLTRSEVWDIIVNTTDDIDALNPGYEGKLGSGRVNAFLALSSINFPRLEVLDFSDNLPNRKAGHDYGMVEITITEENYKGGEEVEISFEIKETETEDVLFSEIKEIGFVTGGETTLVSFDLGVVTTAGNYNAVVTVSATNMIGDFTTNVNFSVFSTTAAYFDVASSSTPLNYVPIFDIENATDVFGNLLDGLYDIDFFVTNSENDVIYNKSEMVTFVRGFLNYEPSDVTPLEEEGFYTIKITVDGIEVEDIFEVSYLPVSEILINEEDQNLMQGDTLQLTFTVNPERASDKSVFWAVDNAEVATITEEGLLTAVGREGAAVVTATSVDGPVDSVTITAVPKTYSVTLREGSGLSGVLVQVYADSAKTETVGSVIETNQQGSVLKEMEAGDYWFTATKSGYSSYSGSFSVTNEDKVVEFTMTLTPSPPPSGGGGSRSSSPPPSSSTENEKEEEKKEEEVIVTTTTEVVSTPLKKLKEQRERILSIKAFVRALLYGLEEESKITEQAVINVLSALDKIEEDLNARIREKENRIRELNSQREKMIVIETFVKKLLEVAKEKGDEGLENTVQVIITTLSSAKNRIEKEILLI